MSADVAPLHKEHVIPPTNKNWDVTVVDNNEKMAMKSEFNRRQSFINWPHHFLETQELAREGFFYTQKLDIVKCAFCAVELGKWELGDVPAKDHRTWSSRCPLVCDLPCGNMPMSNSDSNGIGNSTQSINICEKYGIQVRHNSMAENGTRSYDINQYAIKSTVSYPQFATYDARLKTFSDWPVSISQKPAQLAEAGFYYIGKGDKTLCFSCGGGLQAWEEEDEPWEQHLSWFPTCAFLRLHLTPSFIDAHNKTEETKPKDGSYFQHDMDLQHYVIDHAIPAISPKYNVTIVNNNEERPMKSEFNRRQSFFNWPHHFLERQELARQGFFYTQKQDIVKCAFCNLELGKWVLGDVPSNDHRSWSSKCPHVCDIPCGNIPMSDNDCNGIGNSKLNIDTCGKYGIQVRHNSIPEDGTWPYDINQYAIKSTVSYPQFATYDARLRTFFDWPVSIRQKPAQLAKAGFYYSGKSDLTLCFSCGGGVNAWEEVDEAWEQHASWFPTCSFLRLHRSQSFIDQHNKNEKAKQKNCIVPNTSTSTPAKPVPSLNYTQAQSTTTTTSEPVKTVASSSGVAKSTAASADDEKTKDNQTVYLCKICYSNEIGVVFLPCAHMIACVECAPALTKCAVCRRELEATVRAFLS